MQLWTFLADRTYQRDIKPVPTLSCGGVFRYRSGERLHGMQEVSGSIPLFSTKNALHEHRVVRFFLYYKTRRCEEQGQYDATTLSQVNTEDDSLVGWYDHAGSPAGGWVRVITAAQKD